MAGPVDVAAYKDALIILATTAVFVPVLKRLGVSPIIGFLGVGALLGPTALGRLDDTIPWLSYVVVTPGPQMAAIAELGVVFLLFLIGLELSYERLTRMKTFVLGLGSAQVVTTATVIGVAAWVMGQPAPAALLIGGALALSSTAIVVEHLAAQKRTASGTGRTSFAVLLFQDLAVIPLIFLVGALSARDGGSLAAGLALALGQAMIAVFLVVVVGRRLIRPFFRMIADVDEPEAFIAAAVFVVIGTGVLTAAFGLSMALGAFIAGLLIAETEYRRAIEAALQPFKTLLLGVFFFSVGLSVDWSILLVQPMVLIGALVALLVVKFAILVVLTRAFGPSWLISIRTGLLLAPAGEFAFVLMSLSLYAGLVTAQAAAFVTAITAAGMALIPLLDRIGNMIAARVNRAKPVDPALLAAPPAPESKRVIVVGYGRFGELVGEMLTLHGVPHIGIDRDPREVADLRQRGLPVYFGDAANRAFLESCGIREASALVLTLHTAGAVDEITALARSMRPDITIIARARDAEHAKTLYRLGATDAVPETIEASLQLTEAVLLDIGIPAGLVISSVHDRRDRYRRELQTVGAPVRKPLGRKGQGKPQAG